MWRGAPAECRWISIAVPSSTDGQAGSPQNCPADGSQLSCSPAAVKCHSAPSEKIGVSFRLLSRAVRTILASGVSCVLVARIVTDSAE